MSRALVRIVSYLSLLPCAGVAMLWARSDTRNDQLRFGTARGRYWQINTYSGGVACTVATGWYENQPWERTTVLRSTYYPRQLGGPRKTVQRYADGGPPIEWAPGSRDQWGPVMVERGTWAPYRVPPTMPYVTYDLRYWLLLAVSALPLVARPIPAARRAMRRRRWARAGLCRGCGYNLYGNPTGVCPECGTRRRGDD